MKVLIACEESQRVCIAFRKRGHEAFSADIQEPSGGHPEWHVLGDVLKILRGGRFRTMDGAAHKVDRWDIIIAHPPCTFLTSVSACLLLDSDHQIKDRRRWKKCLKAKEFFMKLWQADCDKVCVENPAPLKILGLPKYTQIIEPYMFGHPWKKRTCLWLRGLEPLYPTDIVKPESCWVETDGRGCRTRLRGAKGARSAKDRSKTFEGIAEAMAEQWTGEPIQYTLGI